MSLNHTIKKLESNSFSVYRVKDIEDSKKVFKDIYDTIKPESVSYGDSETFFLTDLRVWLKKKDIDYIDTFETGISTREKIHRMRMALTVDLFITGSNAVTQDGHLVNLDMIGGIKFDPKHVVIFVGASKIKSDLQEAMNFIRNTLGPENAKRHDGVKTPCKVIGKCMNCNSPSRICNQWLITEKSYPVNRIKIILIEEA